jgi:hypothetical protein
MSGYLGHISRWQPLPSTNLQASTDICQLKEGCLFGTTRVHAANSPGLLNRVVCKLPLALVAHCGRSCRLAARRTTQGALETDRHTPQLVNTGLLFPCRRYLLGLCPL